MSLITERIKSVTGKEVELIVVDVDNLTGVDGLVKRGADGVVIIGK